jgi:hypothetical protein
MTNTVGPPIFLAPSLQAMRERDEDSEKNFSQC